MLLFRCATLAAGAALLSGLVAIDAATAQTPSSPASLTAAEMAKAIAHKLNGNPPTAPSASVTFVSAAAHDNVIDLYSVMQDVGLFARAKAIVNTLRTAMARNLCGGSTSPLNSGVVFHQVITGPDNRDHIDFTVDRSTCITPAAVPQARRL